LEPLNKEIKRRARVVGIFPTTRLSVGSSARSWPTCTRVASGERRYLSEGSMAQLKPTSDTGLIAPIDSGE
jgi:hypothetical protein